MAASSTADLALDDIKKADEIISMAVLGKLLYMFYGNMVCQVSKGGIEKFYFVNRECRTVKKCQKSI